jgi:hypothetical protein
MGQSSLLATLDLESTELLFFPVGGVDSEALLSAADADFLE